MSVEELEQTAAFLHASKLSMRISETCIMRGGDCRGLYWFHTAENSVLHDPAWPIVSAKSVRMFSTKKTNERASKLETIIGHFTREIRASQSSYAAPVAIAMTASKPKASRLENYDTTAALDVEIEYLTGGQFEDYIRHVSDTGSDACIMKYVPPANGFHNLVRVIFTPYMLKVEKHESVFLAHDAGVPLKMRMCTSYSEGKACFNNCEVSPAIEHRALEIREALFQYFKANGCCVDSAIMYFMEINADLVLQWIGKLELKPWHDVKLEQKLQEPQMTQAAVFKKDDASETMRRVLTSEFAASGAARRNVRRPGHIAPPTSPSLNPQVAEMEEEAQVLDFGFYNGDFERIKTSLKKNIRTISRVTNPPSMTLDDEPPYDDNFIRALYDPKFGAVYFAVNDLKSGTMRRISRKGSLSGKVTRAGLNNAVESLNQFLNWRMPKQRSNRSGSGSGKDTLEASSLKSRSVLLASPTARIDAMSFILLDAETQILLNDAEDCMEGSMMTKNRHQMAVQALRQSAPDPRHLGHIQAIRHKYGFREHADEEDDANFKQLVRQTRAINAARAATPGAGSASGAASSQVSQVRTERRTHGADRRSPSVASSKSRASKRPASAGLREYNRTPANVDREKAWMECTVEGESRGPAEPKPHIDPPAPSTVHLRLLCEKIDGFESKLKDVSLMNYLVDTEQFEYVKPPAPLRVPREDLVEDWRSRLHFTAHIPDAPVVELTNTHLSLSEEMLQKRRRCGGKTSRDLLEMLFGDVPGADDANGPAMADASHRGDVSPQLLDSSLSASMSGSPLGATQRKKSFSSLEGTRLLKREESTVRFSNLTKHGVADAREKILLVVGTFEDLLYQWSSSVRGPSQGHARTSPTIIKLHVPPAIYHIRLELRSLLLQVGFTEKSIDTRSVPALEAQFADNDMDVPPIVKEYAAEYNAALAARMTAAGQQLVNDVAEMYRKHEWDTISKIKAMTEEGFTFVDAVIACRPGLVRRASVSGRMTGFSDLGV